MIKLSFLFLFFYGCFNTSQQKVDKKAVTYHQIKIFGNTDTLNGYYNIRNDSLFYLSHTDYIKYNSGECNGKTAKKNKNDYFLFSLKMNKPYSSKRISCYQSRDIKDLDLRDLRNIFYPPEKINDSLWLFKHISVEYDKNQPTIREFTINKDLEIIGLETSNKNDKNYFYYD